VYRAAPFKIDVVPVPKAPATGRSGSQVTPLQLAAAIGGARSGLGAAVVACLGLNYYFTEPHHTLRVDRGADVVALLVFLVVAVVVGTLLAARAVQYGEDDINGAAFVSRSGGRERPHGLCRRDRALFDSQVLTAVRRVPFRGAAELHGGGSGQPFAAG